MVQQLVESQGDGWTHATDELSRFYEHVAGGAGRRSSRTPRRFTELADVAGAAAVNEAMEPFLDRSQQLGRRTAEMHLALAADDSDPAFAPGAVHA